LPAQTESTNLLSPFSDLRVRYGLKLSLASLLSLYVALVLRLEYPNWAVLTALVMMNSHFEDAARQNVAGCPGSGAA
jgi:uncharacterized membrane protein YccC